MDPSAPRLQTKRGLPDYYALLGVRADASFREIEAAYWRRASEQRELIPRLNEAYEVLSNAERRCSYDIEREEAAPPEAERSDGHETPRISASGLRDKLNWHPR